MKYLFKIFFLSYLLIGCESTNNITSKKNNNNMEKKNMNIIHYNTEEFKEFMNKKPKVNLDKAWAIHQQYYNKKLDENIVRMNFIIDNYYVFSEDVNYKLMEASVGGVWIHSETGELKYIKNKTKIILKSQGGWSYYIKY